MPEQDFIRAVSERPPPPRSIDTTVDEVSLPADGPVPSAAAQSTPVMDAGPTKEGGDVADGKALVDTDELVGTTLSKTYEIVRVIGEGGMGRVYEALHKRIASKRFAIKMLHPEYLRQPDVQQRFQREAEAAASINSDHVVDVYDVDRTRDGRPFLVTELLEGEDLGDSLKAGGKLPLGAAVRIVRQVCKALMAAHRRGVVHRDIKPANVFLTGDAAAPVAKVLDFGISRIASQEGNTLTKTGMIMGTPAFMAPEQARGTRVDHRADIYALGAVLYNALTGHEPFEMADPSATLAAVLTREPPRPRSLEPAIPEHLELVIQRAMAKEPEERYPDVAALDAALAPYDGGEPAPAVSSPSAERTGAHVFSHVRPIKGAASAEAAAEALQVKLARPQLALLGIGGLLGLIFLVTSGIGAGLRLAREVPSLSFLEATLILVVVVATLATPAALAVVHVRRNVWDNTAKVLALADALRGPLIAAVAAYGLLAMCIRVLETVVLRSVAGLQWAVWDLGLAVFSLAALGSVILVRRRMRRPLEADDPGAARRRAALPAAVVGVGALLAASGVVASAVLREAPAPTASGDETTEQSPSPSETATSTSTATGPPGAKRATQAELDSATSQGTAALGALHAKYPRDVAVLKAYMLSSGSSPDGLLKAVQLAEQLLALDPKVAKDESVYRFMYKAANGPQEASTKAFGLIISKMGTRGPDLLYEIWTGEGLRSEHAAKLLADERVLRRGTPALRIAAALNRAEGCNAKGALLDQAAQDGDGRVVEILQPLCKSSSSGCGFLGLSSCPARCRPQAADMKKTIATIRKRTQR